MPAAGGDIATAALGAMMEMTLGVRLTFAERLDPGVLARATRLLLDLEPVLGCWYDEGLRGAEWVRCSDLDEAACFAVVESEDPDHEAVDFHATSFDPRGPRLAVLLVRGPERDDLCVRFDHVAGDGWSAKEVAHLLAETYSRLLEDPSHAPPPRTAPRPTHGDVWRALTDEQRAAAAPERIPPFGRSKWRMKLWPGSGMGLVVRTLTLEAERVAAIRAHAHERGATVNEALVAAFVRSAADLCPPKPGVRPGVSVSADTRRLVERGGFDRITGLATTQTVMMDYTHGESFDETLRHVADGTAPHRACLWGVGGPLAAGKRPSPFLLRVLTWFIAYMMRTIDAAALVTMNVGPFDERRLRFGRAIPKTAIASGPIARFAGFAAMISSYLDALTIWTAGRRELIDPALLERMLEGIDRELPAVAPPM
jgi:NRPS condensation-like uncharacterized protein